MRYERVRDLLNLAIRLQAARGGLTLDDIEAEFAISRRTAERRRDAVEAAFGPLDLMERHDGKRHWRLRSDALRRLVSVSPEELAELGAAAEVLDRDGLANHATVLRGVAAKLQATLSTESHTRLESNLDMLLQAEGLAMRPGPRERPDQAVIALLREAIRTRRVVAFRYFAQATGRRSQRQVQPLGLLYGNRTFLVARLVARSERGKAPRLWRLANISEARLAGETFAQDPTFDLQRFAEQSFGTFQEQPMNVVLRFDATAARDASTFLFHPHQTVAQNEDGAITVRFKAGGIDEMCWHLCTWGAKVTVEQPARLRRRLAQLCETLAAHHAQTPQRST